MSDDKNKDIIQRSAQEAIHSALEKQAKKDNISLSNMVFLNSSSDSESNTVLSQMLQKLQKNKDFDTVNRLSLEADPNKLGSQSNLYIKKTSLVPPEILKRIRDTEELIGGVIIPIRARQMLMFSRPRANRFDVGFVINIKPEAASKFSKEELDHLKNTEIPKLRELILNCGKTTGLREDEKRTFGQFLMEVTEDSQTFGWFASEIIRDNKGDFHSFRAVDAGTIYKVLPEESNSKQFNAIRREAQKLLQRVQGKEIDTGKYSNEEYTWVQVADGNIKQVFTDEELFVMNTNPSSDINRFGYPVSPVERILSAVTTHINLTTHNKLFFIQGSSARNVVVMRSNNLEKQDLELLKAQFQASFNSASASHRVPVIGFNNLEDQLQIMPLEKGSRDMEFQYLADLNKRMIFAAFQMSPDEVAALSYLSRGTNSQSLSESNNEWKLIAARDIGLRPILMMMEDFLNEKLLPKISSKWAEIFRIDFEGMDADSPEKESTRIQQDSALYLNMNDIMDRVEHKKVPIGGEIPLNPSFISVIEKYFTKGQILKAFGGKEYENADKIPELNYCMGDPTSVQLFSMKVQMQMQQQMAQQQSQQVGQQQDNPSQQQDQQAGQQQDNPSQQQDQQQNNSAAQPESGNSDELDTAMQQLITSLNKSESPNRSELLRKFIKSKKKIMSDFEKDSKDAVDQIIAAAFGSKKDD